MAVDRNSPCFCGSGAKYKHCHLELSRQPAVPREALARRLREVLGAGPCLHPSGLCSRRVPASDQHAWSYPIARLAEGGQVLAFDDICEVPRLVPLDDAVTFRGFCAEHDRALFAPLADAPWRGSQQQGLLLAYRAFAHTVYAQRRWLAAGAVLALADRGDSPESQMRRQAWITRGRDRAHRFLLAYGRALGSLAEVVDAAQWHLARGWWSRLRRPVPVLVATPVAPVRPAAEGAATVIESLSVVPGGDGGLAAAVWLGTAAGQGYDPHPRLRCAPVAGDGATLLEEAFCSAPSLVASADWWSTRDPAWRERLCGCMGIRDDSAHGAAAGNIADEPSTSGLTILDSHPLGEVGDG